MLLSVRLCLIGIFLHFHCFYILDLHSYLLKLYVVDRHLIIKGLDKGIF